MIIALSLLASALIGWGVTELVLRLAKIPPSAPTPGPQILEPTARDVLRGGTLIGILERLGVTASILAGQPGLIAVVVAIKGLGRWADLQSNPGLTERFIIGTLTSFLVAAAAGWAGLALS